MSDDEQTQLEAHAPVEGGAQLSHGPGTAAETGPAALAGAAEAVTDPPATLRAHMIADLANFVPAGTNVEAVFRSAPCSRVLRETSARPWVECRARGASTRVEGARRRRAARP